jgi:hypothetical protein
MVRIPAAILQAGGWCSENVAEDMAENNRGWSTAANRIEGPLTCFQCVAADFCVAGDVQCSLWGRLNQQRLTGRQFICTESWLPYWA